MKLVLFIYYLSGFFIKAGSIIPKKFIKRLSAIKTMNDSYLLEIYPSNIKNEASGHLYIDDGETFNHINKKEYNLVEFKYNKDNSLEINIIHNNYERETPFFIDAISIFNV